MIGKTHATAAILAACLLAAGTVKALEDPAALLDRVGGRYRGVATVRAGFVQREKVATMGRVRESRGTLYLRRPGQMRWEYSEPDRRLVVSDGSVLWLYYPAEKTVYRAGIGPGDLAQTPLALLFSEKSRLGEVFRTTGAAQLEEGKVRLDLVPIRESRELNRLSLVVDKEGALQGTVIRDAFGNVNEISLSGIVEGARLEDSLFRFQPPEGTRVLEMGNKAP